MNKSHESAVQVDTDIVHGDDVTGSGVIHAMTTLFTSAKETLAAFNLSRDFDAQVPLFDEDGTEHIISIDNVDTVKVLEPGKFGVVMKKLEDNKEVITITVLGVALIGAWKTVRLVRR